jgi:type II secretory pathway pseudopilin PulG
MLRKKYFTIIELLVVISIIAIMAGMLIGGLGGASDKKLEVATKGEIMKLELALEKYKADFGDYPSFFSANLQVSSNHALIADLLKYESFSVDDQGGVVDAWENGIFFIHNKDYVSSYADATKTKEHPKKISTLDVYYNPRSFQLISAGKDGYIYQNSTGTDKTTDNIYNFDVK